MGFCSSGGGGGGCGELWGRAGWDGLVAPGGLLEEKLRPAICPFTSSIISLHWMFLVIAKSLHCCFTFAIASCSEATREKEVNAPGEFKEEMKGTRSGWRLASRKREQVGKHCS